MFDRHHDEEPKSQIRAIASGEATKQRRYYKRSQPSGQSPYTQTKNAIELSSVPSSSEEKFKGGRD